VVVDTIDFKSTGFVVRDKAIQMNRTNDILKGEPKKEALVQIRNKRSEKGRDLSYTTAPLSIFSKHEPYIPNETKNVLLRTSDPKKFITSQRFDNTNNNTNNNNTKNIAINNKNTAITNNKHHNNNTNNNNINDDDEDDSSMSNTNQKPVDFKLYINKYAGNETKLIGAIAKRKHPVLNKNSVECTGPKWEGV
jgi:hypothetical protein